MILTVLRRTLLTPLALVLECAAIPLLGALSLVCTPVALIADRSLRVPRAMIVAVCYLALDAWAFALCAAAVTAAVVRHQDDSAPAERAYVIGTRLLHRLYRVAHRVLDLSVAIDGSDEALAAIADGHRPLIVFSRHAGPGDTFLVVHELLCRNRRTRVLLRAALRADPGIDALGSLLSFYFVRRGTGRSDTTLERITTTVATMQTRGVFVLFPEGGNVSGERAQRRIRRLQEQGLHWQAERASQLHHVGPPFPGGVLAALRGSDTADVIFVAHSGLAGMQGPLWSWIPDHRTLRMRLFLVAAADVPRDADAQTEWLYDWWQRLDDWVGQHAG